MPHKSMDWFLYDIGLRYEWIKLHERVFSSLKTIFLNILH